MESTPDTPMDMRSLTLCTMGHSAFQYFYAGLELGLFGQLFREQPLTRTGIAEKLGLGELPTRCLLFGLTALGLLEKTGDRYANSALINDVCANDKIDLLLKVSRFQAKIVYPGQMDFVESLQSNSNVGLRRFEGAGNDLYSRLTEDPPLQKIFFEFMSAWSAESLPLLLAAVDLSDRQRIVDVGGGDATVAVGLAEAYPQLEVRLLDIPAICSLAQMRIANHGLADRVRTMSSDVFRDDFPADADCILFAHFLVIWSPEENLALLRKAYKALPPGGKVVIFSSMASDEEDGPLFAALDSAYFMAIPAPGGLIYSQRDYETWLQSAGFGEIRRHPCHSWWTPHGVIVGVKG